MIEFKQAEFGYQHPLLSMEHLMLHPGKVYGLVGRNGSGKSTFLQTLIGEVPLLKGDIIIEGRSVLEFQQDVALRSKFLAYVSSMFAGLEALTLEEYVGLGRLPHLRLFGRLQKSDLDRVQQVLGSLNLAELAHKETTKLSDGERQLASLGRAIVQDTPHILLDEPTSFLDYFNRDLLLDLLLQWVSVQVDRTVILSSHDIDLCLQKGIPLLVLHQQQISLLENPSKNEVLEMLET
jgi:iron complex transport system ATP-binding protein